MLAICKSDREKIARSTRYNILRQYKKTKRDEREQIQTEHRLYKQTSSPLVTKPKKQNQCKPPCSNLSLEDPMIWMMKLPCWRL